MKWSLGTICRAALVVTGVAAPMSGARAELVLSQLVVELAPGEQARSDVEAWNNGPDRIFVAIDPREIIAPGTAMQSSRSDPDPDRLGLLVSPPRMILEPGQRKLLRIGSIVSSDRERVYRVTVKPVTGQLSSEGSGLKVLVGYDVLVLVRPAKPNPHVAGARSGDRLTLRNDGNVSVELADGRQCEGPAGPCEDLPGGRLYAGAEKVIAAKARWRVTYTLKARSSASQVSF